MAGFGDMVGRLLARVMPERHPGESRISEPVRTLAGVAVTADTAVQVAAVWACLRYLSQTVAVLPWHVMLEGPRGAEIARTHSVDRLLSTRPSAEWSSFQFRETLTHWALRWGNGYAEIEPNTAGVPYALWPTHPDRVEVCRAVEASADDYGDEIARGELYYEVNNGGGNKSVLSARHMFHIRGFGEGPVGVNVIAYAAQSIGWARAAQLFGAAFFGNNAVPATVVINKKPLKPEGLRRQKQEFEQTFKGPRNSHKSFHVDNDADVKRIGLNSAETQLVEVHQFLIEEICRWFGVPPHKVMHLARATFSNIEHQAIEVVVDSISPWAKRFEDEATFKLFGPQNRRGYYTKMNMNALLRGDQKSRMEFYKGLQLTGSLSPNDIRKLEDQPTIGKRGDVYVMQSQLVPLEKIGEGPVTPPPPSDPPSDPSPDDPAALAALDTLDALMKVDAHVEA